MIAETLNGSTMLCARQGAVSQPDDESSDLPGSLYLFLVELVKLLNEGRFLMIVQRQSNLTTMEGASMLGVSIQSLVNMLENGEIPYHMAGSHRRIYAQDLFRYQAKRGAGRRNILRDLSEAEGQGRDLRQDPWPHR